MRVSPNGEGACGCTPGLRKGGIAGAPGSGRFGLSCSSAMLAPLDPLDTDEPVAKGVTSLCRRPPMSLRLPSMCAEEWYEADRQNVFPVHDTITFRDHGERLHILTTEWYQQTSPFR